MITAVIPVYNEEESLGQLHAELSEVAKQNDYDLEIVFVDDGSSDGSWEEIERLSAHDPRVRGIRFRRNFGKAAALNAGFEDARGELVFTLDADLQDDPKEMPQFLEQIQDGRDVVSGWKKLRHDPWHKVGPSRVFNWLVSSLTGVRLHDHNCGFKCYRREIFDEVHLYGELHRFVPVLASARGWKVGEVVVNHRARQFGHSKYGFRRFVKGFLDLLTVYFLTGYGQRPQHLLGTLGLISFVLGGFGMAALTAWWGISRVLAAFDPIHLHERAIFYYSMGAMLLGAQLVTAGILAEMITASHMRTAKTYSVKQRTKSSLDDAGQEGQTAT
jgi:glycosyltransferase involved in cell wall biosynthesis